MSKHYQVLENLCFYLRSVISRIFKFVPQQMFSFLMVLVKCIKKCVNGCPPFRPILSALQTPTYKLAKYLVPILEPFTKNKYTIKFSSSFANNIVEQGSSNFMGNLDTDSFFY